MNSKYKFFPNIATGYLSDDDTKKYFSRLGFSVLAMMLSTFLMANFIFPFVSLAIDKLFPTLFDYKWFEGIYLNLASMIAIYCVGVPVFYLFSKPLPSVAPFKEKMGSGKFLGGFCIAVLAMTVGNYISNMILVSIANVGGKVPTNQLSELTESAPIWVNVVFGCLLGVVLEELFFRKMLCDRILPLGEGYAIVLSSAIFALMHQNIYQVAYAFLTGLLFSLVYVKTGKLIYTTVYHIIINLMGMVIVPWLFGQIDTEALLGMLESGVFDISPQMMLAMVLLTVYSVAMMVFEIIGLVLLFRATKAKTIRLEAGILPPPKQHRVANIFCNIGVAAAIAYFAFAFVLSMFV